MGQPSHCPHGHPIPTRTGALAVPATQPLTNIPVNTEAQIACANTREPELLRYLASMSSVPGT
jgi:DtxR family Mn-dependent transcriptional regulator